MSLVIIVKNDGSVLPLVMTILVLVVFALGLDFLVVDVYTLSYS